MEFNWRKSTHQLLRQPRARPGLGWCVHAAAVNEFIMSCGGCRGNAPELLIQIVYTLERYYALLCSIAAYQQMRCHLDLSQFISQTVSSKQQEVRSINWWYYEMLVIATSQQMCATNLAELKTVKMEMDQSKEFPVSLHEGWLHCMTLWLLATRLRHCRGYKDIMEQRIEFKKPFY